MDFREYTHWLNENIDKAQQDTKEFHALLDLVKENMIDSTAMLHKFLDAKIKEFDVQLNDLASGETNNDKRREIAEWQDNLRTVKRFAELNIIEIQE